MLKINRKIAAAVAAVGLALAGGGAAYAASSPGTGFQQEACVTFGHGPGAGGNVMEYNWDDSQCPAGTYLVHLAQVPDTDPTATATVTVTPTPKPSGSASSSAPPAS